ncbi:MAG: MMPL family transporter [Bacteroidales bacterium]|nr:MMPL family transporter [Bacteroidales bacterium]
MSRIFLKIYKFFQRKKWLMYTTLIGTTVIFAFFATQIKFEENIFKLLPKTEKATESGIAFSDIKVKDKLFIQFSASEGHPLPASEISELEEQFLENLIAKDSTTHYIDAYLYKLDNDDIMNAMYYAMEHVQAYTGKKMYPIFDSLTSMENVEDFVLRISRATKGSGGFTMIGGYFFSPDSTMALTFINPKYNSADSKQGGRFVKLIESEIAAFTAAHPEIEISYHGSLVTGAFNARQTKKDIVKTVTISLIAILLLVGICFKTKGSLLQLIAPVLYGTLCALAAVSLIKGSMSIIAVGIGAMILGAALSYCLHVLTHYKYVGDPERVISDQATPVCLGCLTTVGAFMGLLFTKSELLQDFGLFATFALIGTTLFALIFLPHFLKKGEVKKNETAFSIVNKINDYPLHKNRIVTIIVSIICISSLFIAHKVGFDSDFRNIGYNSPQELHAKELYNNKINHGFRSKYYAAVANDFDEAILTSRKINARLGELKQQGVINRYTPTSNFIATLEEQENNIIHWKEYWTEKRENEVGALLEQAAEKYNWNEEYAIPETFHTVVQAECEPQSITEADMLPDALLSNFFEKTDDGYLVFTPALMPAENIEKTGTAVSEIENAIVIDPFFYTSDMIEVIHSDFNTVLLISSIFVFIVLLISFRSFFTAILAFIPMFFSWFVLESVMYLFGIEFNLISIMISSFIFGIGVDYSIFMVDGLIHQAKSGSDELLAHHKAAILFSIFALLVVTGSLIFAVHPAIHSVGVSTLIGMLATILITYAIQPLVFRFIIKNNFIRKRILHEK